MNKKKILIISILPYPPHDGGKISTFLFIENLRNKFDFTVIFQLKNKDDIIHYEQLKSIWSNVKLVGVKTISDKRETKIKKVKRFIKKLYISPIIFYEYILKGFSKDKKFDDNFNDNYFLTKKNVISNLSKLESCFIERVTNICQEVKFDLIQIESFIYISLINILPHNAKRVYIEIESQYLIFEDFAKLDNNYSSEYKSYIKEHIKKVEINYLNCFDGVVSISHGDQERLSKLLPDKIIYFSPYTLLEEPKQINFSSGQIKKLIFIGPEGHFPNKDGIDWFIKGMHSELIKLNLKLFVIGNWRKSTVNRYSAYSNVIFTGFVEDLTEYYENSLNVIPIRLGGGGLRAKNILSLKNGIPMLSTRLGCYGVSLKHSVNVLYADEINEFIEVLNFAVKNPKIIAQIINNGIFYYETHLSKQMVISKREEIYNSLLYET